MKELKPLKIGSKYNRLTIIKFSHIKVINNRKYFYYLCKCDCGNICVKEKYKILSNHTKSCGCLSKEISKTTRYYKHNLKDSKLYKVWQSIKTRCYNKKAINYYLYGGRGITICDEWINDFVSFYNWSIANGYKEDLTIDRIDVNGNYEPNNCRWVDMKIQANNRRNNTIIEYQGEKHTIAEWSDILKIPQTTIIDRIEKNYSIEDILSKKYFYNKNNKIFITYNNQTKSLKEWSIITNIKYATLFKRYKSGWSINNLFNN